MELWPADEHKLRRIISCLLFLSFTAFICFAVVFIRFKELGQDPPLCGTVSSFHIDTRQPPCPQRIDNSGWEIKNGQVNTFPRCLTVMNSRFGSRFNLDLYFSSQKAASSVLGTLEDRDALLNLRIQDENKVDQAFPLMSNDTFPIRSIELGSTFQKINFEKDDLLLSLTVKSPFSPTVSLQDENTKMSTAPFFYLELSLKNKTPRQLNKTVVLSMGNAKEIQTQDGYKIVYLKDGVRKEGIRALAAQQNIRELDSFIDRGQAGFHWQVEIKPYSTATTNLVYTGFIDAEVMSDVSQIPKRRKLKFAYNLWFDNIEEVIQYAFDNQEKINKLTDQFEKNIQRQNLTPQQKWLLAQALHSYLGNTWLLYDEENPETFEYYVWEGEFKYLNTVDVAHDYAVLEGLYFPWVLKLELRSWQKSVKKDDKGVVIPHDVGHRFRFTGSQTYGIEGAETSGMPVEENTNFILLSHWYWHQTGDDEFIEELSPLIKDLVESLINRDTNGNGIADQRIGMTTYDNDGNSALKEAPDSSYLALKQLAAYISAEEIFESLGDEEAQQLASRQAEMITDTLKTAFDSYGFIPLTLDQSFEEKNKFAGETVYGIKEQGFAFITGFLYPALTNADSKYINRLKPILADTYKQAYEKCLVKDESGNIVGLKLAENQALSLGWLSHSVIADVVAKRILSQEYDSAEIYFPLLFDNPYSYTDGQFFREPFYPPQHTLIFYPRGAALFSLLVNGKD